MAARLRAVMPNEGTPEPLTLTEAAEKGDARAMLVATRTLIAQTLASDKTLARDMASLSKRLMEVNASIATIDAKQAQEVASGEREAADETWEAV